MRLLAAYLVIVGLAWAGLLPSHSGLIPPNAGLLVVADVMIALLVVWLPAASRKGRRGGNLSWAYGRRGVLLSVLAFVLIVASLFGEIGLASELPPPPARAACDDYGTWVFAQVKAAPPSYVDEEKLTRAAREAPRGPLRQDLTALVVDVHAAISAWNTSQGSLGEQQLLAAYQDDQLVQSDMNAVTTDCSAVTQQ
jgi:hypothetical protein